MVRSPPDERTDEEVTRKAQELLDAMGLGEDFAGSVEVHATGGEARKVGVHYVVRLRTGVAPTGRSP